MSKILEIFGQSTKAANVNWQAIVEQQQCPFIRRTCYKVRKSNPNVAIGTCAVSHGKEAKPIVICPSRLIDRRHVFTDCLHLLTTHEPGNELHVIPEVSVPGGNVDYFLASARKGKVKDFVGIEIQTLDTTGTIWPERWRLLRELGVNQDENEENSKKVFGINWKMTAKTILIQIHHKIQTFEHVNKKLVLVVQDALLEYMENAFDFSHLRNPARIGDSMHFHSYSLAEQPNSICALSLKNRWSADAVGIAQCLGLQTEAKVELDQMIQSLEGKISTNTLFTPA